jgi:hypothetical protein
MNFKQDGVTESWGKLHNKEFFGLYSSPDMWVINEEDEVGGTQGTHREE